MGSYDYIWTPMHEECAKHGGPLHCEFCGKSFEDHHKLKNNEGDYYMYCTIKEDNNAAPKVMEPNE